MIFVGYDTPDDDAWRSWNIRAASKTQQLKENVQLGGKPEIDDTFYKEMRAHLLDRFNRKCAYCETHIHRFPVDVEHFRPKGRVTDATRAIVKIQDTRGRTQSHPGYYWLAYAWENLLPSCIDCNRKRYHDEQDAMWGKESCFPVAESKYIWSPSDDLASEKPLLLNPRFVDPSDHLHFVVARDPINNAPYCAIKAKSEAGDQTIKVFGLHDENFAAPRMEAYRHGYRMMKELTDRYDDLEVYPEEEARRQIRETTKEINAVWGGSRPYTAYARRGMETYITRHKLNIQFPLRV